MEHLAPDLLSDLLVIQVERRVEVDQGRGQQGDQGDQGDQQEDQEEAGGEQHLGHLPALGTEERWHWWRLLS